MIVTARLLAPLAVFCVLTACQHPAPDVGPASAPTTLVAAPGSMPLQPSPNKLVGRILAIDAARGFAFVNLTAEPPPAALADGAELVARNDDLHETARLRTSRYLRGHTLGTTIVSGQPAPGNEVVIRVP